MALTNILSVQEEGKKGGGLFGSIAGAVVGGLGGLAAAAAAPITGGASLAAIPGAIAGGMAAGSTLGGIAGEAIDPSKAASESPVISHSEAQKMPLQSMQMHPEVQLATLQDAQNALKQDGSLPADQMDQYGSMLTQAQMKIKQRMGL